jgi:uncharacterized DUF497 family protein
VRLPLHPGCRCVIVCTYNKAAQQAFSDPALLAFEPQIERGEYRFPVLGMIGDHTILYITYAYEIDPATGEEIIRIISARKASSNERRLYHDRRLPNRDQCGAAQAYGAVDGAE